MVIVFVRSSILVCRPKKTSCELTLRLLFEDGVLSAALRFVDGAGVIGRVVAEVEGRGELGTGDGAGIDAALDLSS